MEKKELFEKPSGRSETIPNQGLKIGDLMNRSTRLQNLPIFPDMEGDDEDHGSGYLDDIEDKFDLMDRLTYLESRQAEVQRLQAQEAQKKAESEFTSSPNPKDKESALE